MPNRILKDSIWDSPTLAALPDFIEDQFPRWLLLADDWGCFCADADSIKGKVYPKRPKITAKIVEEIRLAFYEAGFLFCWVEGGRIWGHWANFGAHNYLTSIDDDGARLKLRRRTPEPPAELLAKYKEKYGTPEDKKERSAAPWDNLEQRGAVRDKTANPDPDPDLDSDSKLGKVVEEEAPPPVTPDELHAIYERERGDMHHCMVLTGKRRNKCLSRISERNKDPSGLRRDFTESVRKASAIPFFVGSGERGWKGDFDWFIENDTNYTKVLEGKYDGNRRSKAEERSRRQTEAAQQAFNDMDAAFGGNDSPAGERGTDAGEDQGIRRITVGLGTGGT